MQKQLEKFKKRIETELFLYLPENHLSISMNITEEQLYAVFELCQHRFDGKKIAEYLLADSERRMQEEIKEKENYRQLAEKLKVFPKKQIFFTVCKKDNISLVKTGRPCRVYENIGFLYHILLQKDAERIETVAFTNQMCIRWDVREEELYLAGIEHMPKLFPYVISEKQALHGTYFWISSISFGLSTLFYEENPLKEIAGRTMQDLWVVPLSIHEAAVFPVESICERQLENLLAEGNYFDTVWFYNRKAKQIAINQQERRKIEMLMKMGIQDAAERIMEKDGR